MSEYDVAGRVALITGAAGGIGSGLARRLVARGARVALLDLPSPALDALAAELGTASLAVPADVTDPDAVDAAVAHTVDAFGGLDVAVANAGVGEGGPVADMPLDQLRSVVDVNLLGVWYTLRAAIPHVVARRGYLLVTSSVAAFVHMPMMGAYSATKAGVLALADSLRLELLDEGVAVGTLHPSFARTAMVEQAAEKEATRILLDDFSGPVKLMPVEQVVDAAVLMIRRRSRKAVVPRSLWFLGTFPALPATRGMSASLAPRERVRRALEAARRELGEQGDVPAIP
jgi:NAD(P)-dependent dehydrogenase (short-subunit alcohol dehydrogenase family)